MAACAFSAPFRSNAQITEISCHARGANLLFPKTRTVIDMGGQDAKGIRIGEDGDVKDFVMNDKCAAGTGRFLSNSAETVGL
ncbi:MAG: 3-hydroxyacyl-ACP dehydratase, partial [Acidobacteriia bacterium]|nr:3-hydroxyacyl-ACP dehydratase [Terriglobia bacterium]